jgi:hypothetical protein
VGTGEFANATVMSDPPSTVPEPGAVLLIAGGLAAIGLKARKRVRS